MQMWFLEHQMYRWISLGVKFSECKNACLGTKKNKQRRKGETSAWLNDV